MSMHGKGQASPVIKNLADFDQGSGSLVERLIFNNRLVVLLLCGLMTAFLGSQLPRLQLAASYEKMIPQDHPFVVNFQAHRTQMSNDANVIRIVVETRKGTILNPDYLQMLQHISDDVYGIPGVDRPYMKSLWTSNMRWIAVTEEGLTGGKIIDTDYDGSPASLARVRLNIERSGGLGQSVALDFKSSEIVVPLLDRDTETHLPLDYRKLSHELEAIRTKYQTPDLRIHITGFGKIVGDLMDGLTQMMAFFGIALALAASIVYWYTRCVRSTVLVMLCSLIAVTWQLGILPLLGMALDPYSVLVPFLVFAIGVSHGTQKMNGVMQDIGRGIHRLVAARYTFRRLFMAGFAALMCDAVGFAVLMVIKIEIIRELALIASLGVGILIFTNLILLPTLLSYTGVGSHAAERSLRAEQAVAADLERHALWRFLDLFTHRKVAGWTLVGALVLAVGGWYVGRDLAIGDLNPGAPELRANSRYNIDNAYLTHHYGASSDELVVMITTPINMCANYETLQRVDRLEWQLRQLPGVASTTSFATFSRFVLMQLAENNVRWLELLPNQTALNDLVQSGPRELVNPNCDLSTLTVYLQDHKAETLTRVVDTVAAFAAANNTPNAQFLLAAGNSGVDAATNIVVEDASNEMLYWVYGAVILLCFITFRSWRAVVCSILPLILTSILAQALMVWLHIGIKVATLPVTALGVGIGVDYALYVMSIVLVNLRQGLSLSESYYRALLFTGRVVLLTGVTLSVGVATWAFSPIKFQADMGILLAFCFLWNMLGALILAPALCSFIMKQEGGDRTSSTAIASGDGKEADRSFDASRSDARIIRKVGL